MLLYIFKIFKKVNTIFMLIYCLYVLGIMEGVKTDDYIRDPDYPTEAYFKKPHSGNQASSSQNSTISAGLKIDNTTGIRYLNPKGNSYH